MPISSGENRVNPARTVAFLLVMLSLFILFAVRLFYLQVILGGYYLGQAENNRVQRVSIPASRGVIYDRNGTLLARNMPSYNITVTPAYLPENPAEVQDIYRTLSQLTGVPIRVPDSRPSAECAPGRGIEDLVKEWEGLAPYHAVKIQCDADPTAALIIQERAMDMPGVGVEVSPVRDYPNGRFTAHVIGYMGRIPPTLVEEYQALGYNIDRDKIGYTGIEASQQSDLSGTYGSKVIEVDAAGKEIRLLEPPVQPVPGVNLRLTIDARLQEAATVILERQMAITRNNKAEFLRSPVETGVVIAMNPQTGEILALVSVPTYDNEKFSRFIPYEYYALLADDISKPLLNHAIAGSYPPGSVFKMATAVGALNQGVVTPETIFTCRGQISITQRFYPGDPGQEMSFFCYNRSGHGQVSFLYGVAQSCDIYFYNLGALLTITGIKRYAQALGYGQILGIELPGEVAGTIPDEDWKRINKGENWATGDTYISTIGQGYVDVTPLQVLESIATIANGGRVVKPTLLSAYLDGEGNVLKTFSPTVLWDITNDNTEESQYDLKVEPWVLEMAQEGMREVVSSGTAAKYAKIDEIPSAGKTGTAEYCDDIATSRGLCIRGQWPTHSWYVAYAPPDNPEIIILAFVYNGGEGSITSGPIVRDVLKAYYEFESIDAENAR